MAKVAIYGLMVALVPLCLAWIWGIISPQHSPRREVKVRSKARTTAIRRTAAGLSERTLR